MRLDWIRHGAARFETALSTHFTSAAEGLSEDGVHQATRLGELLASRIGKVDAVYSSPAQRAIETATVLLAALKAGRSDVAVPHFEVEHALRQRSYGSWEGQLKEAIFSEPGLRERFFEDAAFRPPGGESIADIRERVEGWIKRQIADPADTRHCLIVSHCKAIEAACNYFRLLTPIGAGNAIRELGFAESAVVARRDGKWMFEHQGS